MEYIINGIKEAFSLIFSFNSEVYKIVALSVMISSISTIISALIGVPLGVFSGLKEFRFKKLYSRILYTLMSLPPVVVGLSVSLILARRGPLGSLGLMYTILAMIIAQTCLVIPIITGNVFNYAKKHGVNIYEVGKTLGGNRWNIFILLIKELKYVILIAIVSGLGRAISEVGAIMIVGGNIKNHTRVMTTYIAMSNSMGEYEKAIAMGIILLLISFSLNSILYKYSAGDNG